MMHRPHQRSSASSRMEEFRKCRSLDDLAGGSYEDREMSQDEDSSYASSEEEGNVNITLLERLIRTHPVWFLPSLQRSGAIHLLQGREVGNFIVRSSTQPNTMAVSVKLPHVVEHYLLRAVDNRIALENSNNTFETVHQLINHYCSVSDEIPVCLKVPTAIADAVSRQQLRSLALLGQEFWTRSPLKETSSPSDVDVSRNFVSSGLGSQSSSQNSLPDNRPNRPTTLNLNSVPKPPPRWAKSTLMSSVQSTPTESIHSMCSISTGATKKKKKKTRSSIHYKDVELFKGKRTNWDDKASDYEDIWSPMNRPKPMTTFKPNNANNNNVNNNRLSLFESKYIYSEPVDSLRFKRFGAHRHSEPNIRWSQVMISPSEVQARDELNREVRREWKHGGHNGNNPGDMGRRQPSKPKLSITNSLDNLWQENAFVDSEKKSRWPPTDDQAEVLNNNSKFPIITPPLSPSQRNASHRFSRYDNLEYHKSDENILSDENISQPWDSSKWEYLLKIVSDSTMQLDYVSGQNDKNKAANTIHTIVRDLADESPGNGVFGPTLKSFVTCTLAAKSKDPMKIMGNVRQFMNGMKNYLTGTSSSETERLRSEIRKQTELLNESEFLNIDSILEDVLIDLILQPLFTYIIELLNEMSGGEFRVVCDSETRDSVPLQATYDAFRDTCSPLVKLRKWKEFVSQVQGNDSENSVDNLADALASVCTPDLKSHVDYTLNLLPHSVLEDNSYLLNLLQSVIEHLQNNTAASIKVLIPDERNGTLLRKILPVQSTTTNSDIIKMIATKLGIANTGDYVLVKIKNGEEKICPDTARVDLSGEHTALAFKRLDAKIGWPAKI